MLHVYPDHFCLSEIQVRLGTAKKYTRLSSKVALSAYNLDDTFTLLQFAGRNGQQFRREEEA
jgi:hypothetical protein